MVSMKDKQKEVDSISIQNDITEEEWLAGGFEALGNLVIKCIKRADEWSDDHEGVYRFDDIRIGFDLYSNKKKDILGVHVIYKNVNNNDRHEK